MDGAARGLRPWQKKVFVEERREPDSVSEVHVVGRRREFERASECRPRGRGLGQVSLSLLSLSNRKESLGLSDGGGTEGSTMDWPETDVGIVDVCEYRRRSGDVLGEVG